MSEKRGRSVAGGSDRGEGGTGGGTPRSESRSGARRSARKGTGKAAAADAASERAGAGNGSAGGLTYASSGVDLETYDQFIDSLGAMLRRTHGPRVIDNEGGFAGLFRLDYNQKLFKRNYKDPVLVASSDGVGTKLKLATAMRKFDTVGIDLVAMSINDLIVQGAEPLFFLDYIAVPKVDRAMLLDLVKGVSDACRACSCALLGGETAEMPGVYGADEFDMAGFAVGVVELSRATDSLRVRQGDIVLGLGSDGLHSNGFSLVRHIVDHAGADLHAVDPSLDPDRPIGEVLLTPTRLYADPIVRLLRAYKVKKVISGMAHITGGGLADNLARALPVGLDATIDRHAWEPPRVFRWLQEKGRVDEEEMRRVFNMGIGYTLIVRPTFADSVTERLTKMGERVFTIGRIVKGKAKQPGRVREKA